jgi:hypothetical protein
MTQQKIQQKYNPTCADHLSSGPGHHTRRRKHHHDSAQFTLYLYRYRYTTKENAHATCAAHLSSGLGRTCIMTRHNLHCTPVHTKTPAPHMCCPSVIRGPGHTLRSEHHDSTYSNKNHPKTSTLDVLTKTPTSITKNYQICKRSNNFPPYFLLA